MCFVENPKLGLPKSAYFDRFVEPDSFPKKLIKKEKIEIFCKKIFFENFVKNFFGRRFQQKSFIFQLPERFLHITIFLYGLHPFIAQCLLVSELK